MFQVRITGVPSTSSSCSKPDEWTAFQRAGWRLPELKRWMVRRTDEHQGMGCK